MGYAPASASEAMDMVHAGLSYLASLDAAQLPAGTQAECLQGLERTDAIVTAARAWFLSAFTAGQGYSADADYSPRAWLMHKTGITRGAAASHTAWAGRATAHPRVVTALAAGDLSESCGRAICRWTDTLPEKYRDESDELLGARLGGPSLPLDIGYSETIPAGIRNAVMLRDRHCQWAGGCDQPAAACEVHHVKHKANGGKTSVKDCVLLCTFHHQIVIHRRGWTLVLNPDGTTTAWNKDKTKVLHSHGPPIRPG
jgi:hypothetical protein